MFDLKQCRIAIIGLGYVGLPLAVAFAEKYRTIGFDINKTRVNALKQGRDETLEVSRDELLKSQLNYCNKLADIAQCNVYIVTVPTPIDSEKKPDLKPLIAASEALATLIKKGDIVIYESTVYPGATKEVCVPCLEKSGLVFNVDFFVAYSPERINPGDKKHRVNDIVKVTSGSTPACADFVDDLYQSIITAGTHKAASIEIAEAAKIIENTQRDLNIALINELAMLFNQMDIDTESVLKAAATKWNFLPFKPGLVGGHCIGVDPYYLTHKAEAIGFKPNIILAGRQTNDAMADYVGKQIITLMEDKKIKVAKAKVLIMGITFKENCPDCRNTRVVDIIRFLNAHGISIDVYDPQADCADVKKTYGIELIKTLKTNCYDGIVLAVAHDVFKKLSIEAIRQLGRSNHFVYDIKHLFAADLVDGRL